MVTILEAVVPGKTTKEVDEFGRDARFLRIAQAELAIDIGSGGSPVVNPTELRQAVNTTEEAIVAPVVNDE